MPKRRFGSCDEGRRFEGMGRSYGGADEGRTPSRPRQVQAAHGSCGHQGIGTCPFGDRLCRAVFAVHATEPGVVSLGDAVWLCFQVVTTIGLGDFTSTTMVGRLAIMLLSAYSVFFLAIVTGAVVSYCSEVMRRDWDEDVSELLDELDRLPELSRGGAGRIFRSCEKGSFPSAPLASALAVSLFLAARFLSATCIETNWRSHDSVHQAGKRVDCA